MDFSVGLLTGSSNQLGTAGVDMNACLLLIDLQNDYFPGGAMELVGSTEAVANAQQLLLAFRCLQRAIIHVQHVSVRQDVSFFLPGTVGVEFHPRVTPQCGETVVTKHLPNSFRNTGLDAMLRQSQIDHLVICGAMSHMCVDATTRAGYDLGYTCTVVEDACATRNLTFRGRTVSACDVHAAFMAALASSYAQVIETRTLLNNVP